jgi:hypothetical protein
VAASPCKSQHPFARIVCDVELAGDSAMLEASAAACEVVV